MPSSAKATETSGPFFILPRGNDLETVTSFITSQFCCFSETAPIYTYDSADEHGVGHFLGGTLGSSKQGTTTISDDYEVVPFVTGGKDGTTKQFLFDFLKRFSQENPRAIVSLKEFNPIPIVLEARVKNAVIYGLKFNKSPLAQEAAISFDEASAYQFSNHWAYTSEEAGRVFTYDFSRQAKLPNQSFPTDLKSGAISILATPGEAVASTQTLLRLYGSDDENDLGIYYDAEGNFRYTLKRDGMPYAQMIIPPPIGKKFAGHQVQITLESVKYEDRKYGRSLPENTCVLRVFCPDLGLDHILQQEILWNWKHAPGSITDSDRANARAFAYLQFSAFSPGMTNLTIGGEKANPATPFTGTIHRVEFADKLAPGENDFLGK